MTKLRSYILLFLWIVLLCFQSVLTSPENEELEGNELKKITLSQNDRATCNSDDRDCKAYEDFKEDERLVRLEGVKVGHVQNINIVEGQTHELVTRSMKPLMFEIANFLSADECDHIIHLAKIEGLTESATLNTGKDDNATDSSNTNTNTTNAEDEKQEQIKQCKEMIVNYDSDKNGQLNGAELASYLDNISSILLKEKEVLIMLKELKFDDNTDGELSYEECLKVNVSAFEEYVDNLEDNHPSYRSRTSQQAWLPIDENSDPVLVNLRDRIKKLTKLPNRMIEESEHLQVVRYSIGGHFHAHYDSTDKRNKPCCRFLNNDIATTSCNLCRFMTILYYLNNVTRGGETAFPVADNKTFDVDKYEKQGLSNLSTRCYQSNIIVPPRKGTAILWYNHEVDHDTGRMGPMDKFSLHGGCDVLDGVKWIANNWINEFLPS